MDEAPDWSLASWEGSRRRQHQQYHALTFREKLEHLEQLERLAAALRLNRGGDPAPPRTSTA